ncbi:hypothetical protein [Labrenzia sp. VG12]|uniref:hypothetical protein n=1 Tax=Labrenzia sp. VG12 TaxID=2021862 RepID=UPI000B8C5DE8|nr:hypothetical protein [Labrenzia sp. VG12]ASP32212.1 hypothetical protein CHH27_02300 [Labrenzia sp. VG12]
MGILVLADDTDVPFPRRLFAEMERLAVERGGNREAWQHLAGIYRGSGCMLDLAALDEGELSTFKEGFAHLLAELAGKTPVAGLDVTGLTQILGPINRSLNN